MSRSALLFVLLLLLPATASAKAPSPLAGGYLFIGGGIGLQTGIDANGGIAATPRWGPTLELGGDLGPLTAAVGADMRILVADFGGGCCAPFDLDVVGALGVILPTPLIRPFLRVRGGVGWRITPGLKGVRAPASIILAPDLGLRIRLPATPAAFQIAVGVGPRMVPGQLQATSVEAELKVGLKFP
jgi:hypothetical protein